MQPNNIFISFTRSLLIIASKIITFTIHHDLKHLLAR
jgi:hypothetical protein